MRDMLFGFISVLISVSLCLTAMAQQTATPPPILIVSTPTPTATNTPMPTSIATPEAGGTYVDPTYGWQVTWGENWTRKYDAFQATLAIESDDISIIMVNYFNEKSIPMLDSATFDTCPEMIQAVVSSTSASPYAKYEPLHGADGNPIRYESLERSYVLLLSSVEGGAYATVNYFECRPVPLRGELIYILASTNTKDVNEGADDVQQRFNEAIPQLQAILDTLVIPGA